MAQSKRDPYKLVGTTLDRYQIEELVGIGGMGVVYRAQHEITKDRVAIKILRPDLTISNDVGVSLFFEEATKTTVLKHRSIVKVTSADYTADGAAYMVMEWLDGCTLDKEMSDHGAVSLHRANALLEQIADAVAYAHRKGIIHRDLKPSNIMLVKEENGEETIRVLDFGIAKVLSTTVGTNTRVAGTSYYISPEQSIAQSQIDHRTDIYSLGVILYQMLTGQVPFEADSEGQVIDMHRSLSPEPLRLLRPGIPPAVEEVVLKAMAKKPQDRFQTATDFARAFRQAANLGSSVLILQSVDTGTGAAVSSADIYLNGRHVGQSDEGGWWRQNDMMPRQYLIEVESSRYLRWHKSVNLEPREELTVVAKLEREQVGEIIIACNVPDVEVKIDDETAGRTDQSGRLYIQSVAAGTHVLRLTHSQYLPIESIVEVPVWQQTLVRLELNTRPQRNPIKQVMRKVESLFERPKASPQRDRQSQPPIAVLPDDESKPASQTKPREVSFSGETQVCRACGSRIPANLKFCTQCGVRVEVEMPTDIYGTNPLTPEMQFESTMQEPPKIVPVSSGAPILKADSKSASRQIQRPVNKLPWIVASVVALLAAAIAVGIIFSSKSKHKIAIVTSPPNSRIVVDERIENVTDDQGRWLIEGLESGPHTIRVSKPGYKEIIRSVTLPLSQPLEPIALELVVPEGMVYIPGGAFQLGYGDGTDQNPSGPPKNVTISPYFIDRFEVTQEAYRKDGTLGDEARKPMTGVTWSEADGYCKSVGKRLPTEEEWEFAARGSDARLYPWGNSFESGKANINNPKGGFTPVGSYTGGNSPFGVSDLSGNAWEWTASDFLLYPGSQYRPRICREPCKVLRGGAYDSSPDHSTTVHRVPYEPTSLARTAYKNTGFRCAKDIVPK